MKTTVSKLLAGLALISASTFAQSIDVKPAGVDIGATATGATGALIKQEGAEVSILHKDGVNPPELRVIVTDEGNVGIGTDAPAQKLDVDGNAIVRGTVTVGSLVVGTSPIFTEGYFESTPQNFPAQGATLVVEHGLSDVPRLVSVSMRCISPEYGWEAGDEILLNSIHMRANDGGFTYAVNGVNFKFRRHSYLYIHRMDATGIAYIDIPKWRLIFRAWR